MTKISFLSAENNKHSHHKFVNNVPSEKEEMYFLPIFNL